MHSIKDYVHLSVDVNECKEVNDCHEKATCSNTIGSYQCQCLEVYVGDGKACVGKTIHLSIFH